MVNVFEVSGDTVTCGKCVLVTLQVTVLVNVCWRHCNGAGVLGVDQSALEHASRPCTGGPHPRDSQSCEAPAPPLCCLGPLSPRAVGSAGFPTHRPTREETTCKEINPFQ